MINRICLLFVVLFFGFTGCRNKTDTIQREIQPFNSNWTFAKDLPGDNYSGIDSVDSTFEQVTLPHTAQIEPLVVNNQWQGTCWYRKSFAISASKINKNHFLYFEGAMQNTDVYLNGTHLKHHKGGYLPFIVDITQHIDYNKKNILAVKLVNVNDSLVPPGKPLEDLDFNMYGGIYRPVKLISVPKLYITNPFENHTTWGGGIKITFDTVTEKRAGMHVTTHVRNSELTPQNFTVNHQVFDSAGALIVENKSVPVHLENMSDKSVDVSLEVATPKLWAPDHPYQYQLKTQILINNQLIDEKITSVGFRNVELSEKGLFLNGEKIFLRGTNRHQEYPYIGYALSDEAQWRDAVKIKNAGFNAVRLSHYPHSEAFMDACDALGLVTMNAIPGWQFNGNEAFKKNVLKDVRDLIWRDRNRTSVFFWELSLNESWMLPEFMDSILQVKNEQLPERDAITCAWIDYKGYDLFIPARQHGKPPHYWNFYKDGKRPVFIAEYGDWEYYAQNAGFNQKTFSNLREEERTSRQLRRYGEKRLLQQALNYQEATNSNRKGIGTIGHANWLMFDYNRGYANDIEASGISDIFRIPKFAYYFYKSQRDFNEKVAEPANGGAMVKIASYWTPGSNKNIRVFSNCHQVELYLNGDIIARQKPDSNKYSSHLKHPPFTFELSQITPGTLVANGYINNKLMAKDTVATSQNPAGIQLTIDKSGIPVTINDVAFVYAILIDENGTTVPENDMSVEFSITGQAKLIGINPAITEAGIATILVKTPEKPGDFTIKAKSKTFNSVINYNFE